MTNDANIRLECLKPAERWAQPTGEEVREVLRLAGFSGSKAAKALGLGQLAAEAADTDAGDALIDRYHFLRGFAASHAEAAAIYRAID